MLLRTAVWCRPEAALMGMRFRQRCLLVMECRDVRVSEIRDPVCRIARATLLLLSLLGQSAAAATIAISIVSHADTIEIEGSALLNADAGVAWRVLTDYERYVDFIPGLRGSRVVARKGATVIVEESGDVMLWVLHRPMDVTFEILEYTGVLDSGLALVGPIERLAVKQNVALRFQALAEEIERRSAANRGRSVPM